MLIAGHLHEVSHPYRLNLHYVPNVEVEDPLVLVQKAQYCAHVDLVLELL